jgi:membrane-associated protein
MEWIQLALSSLHQLVQVESLQAWLASHGWWFYGLILLILFCETGLVFTPFLPGDSLLFAMGALAAISPETSLTLLIFAMIGAAVLGDAVNYAIGSWLGPKVFRWEKSWLFNPAHLEKSHQFFLKYGPKTIIFARFAPIVRTFAPFLAGIGKMPYSTFGIYNVIGAVAWVGICTLAGYFLGNFDVVRKHFELAILAVIFLSILPLILEVISARRQKGTSPATTDSRQD